MANPYRNQQRTQSGFPSVRMPTFNAAPGVPSVPMPYVDPLRHQAKPNVFGPPVVTSPKGITPRMIRETQKGPKLPPYSRAVPSPQDRATLSSQEPRLFNMESNPTRTKSLVPLEPAALPKPDRVGKGQANAYFKSPIFPIRSHLEPVPGESLDGRLRETFGSDSQTYLDRLAEANKSLPAPKRRLRTDPALIPEMPSVSNSLAARPSPVEMDTTLDSLTGISTNLARPTELVGGGPSSEMGRSSGGRPRLQLGSPASPSTSDLNAFTTEGQRELREAQGAAKLWGDLAGIGTSPKPMTEGPTNQQQAALDRGAAASSFLRPGGELTKLYERQEGGNSSMLDSSNPVGMLMPAPRRPSLAEAGFRMEDYGLGQGPTRSETSRSAMQPGGMGDGSAFDRLRQRDADRVSAANARPMASTQNEVDSDSFQHHYGPDVTSDVKAFVNTGRELNSAAGRDYRKQLNQGLDGNLAARKAARLSGETYTDPHTGEVTDYGKFNEYRERLAEGPTLENMSDQRKLRMRRAQLRNYGSTGGVTVAPGGGIGGPLTVGMQRTFGPNMSLNQATRMAQGQLDQENRLRDAQERQDKMIADQQRRQDVSTYIETAQQDPALARQFAEQVGLEGFAGKTSAEVAQEMENKSAMRVQLSENPQSILDIARDVREQFPSDPERQQEELAKLGISPDMVSSAMERTKPGFLDRATGVGKSILAAGARVIGQGIDGASENPVVTTAIPGMALLPSGAGAALGGGASQYILEPDQDEQDRLRARRLIQLNNSSR